MQKIRRFFNNLMAFPEKRNARNARNSKIESLTAENTNNTGIYINVTPESKVESIISLPLTEKNLSKHNSMLEEVEAKESCYYILDPTKGSVQDYGSILGYTYTPDQDKDDNPYQFTLSELSAVRNNKYGSVLNSDIDENSTIYCSASEINKENIHKEYGSVINTLIKDNKDHNGSTHSNINTENCYGSVLSSYYDNVKSMQNRRSNKSTTTLNSLNSLNPNDPIFEL